MQNWFECRVKYLKIDDNGRERKVTETMLFDAVTYTDAEAHVTEQLKEIINGEFVIEKISKSNIFEIFAHETGEWWFKGKISIGTIDENSGREKKINNYFLVAADDIKEALQRLEEGLSYILVPYTITSLSVSSIVDVYPYFEKAS